MKSTMFDRIAPLGKTTGSFLLFAFSFSALSQRKSMATWGSSLIDRFYGEGGLGFSLFILSGMIFFRLD